MPSWPWADVVIRDFAGVSLTRALFVWKILTEVAVSCQVDTHDHVSGFYMALDKNFCRNVRVYLAFL